MFELYVITKRESEFHKMKKKISLHEEIILNLNRKNLTTNLSFWFRFILNFVFKTQKADFISQKHSLKFTVTLSTSSSCSKVSDWCFFTVFLLNYILFYVHYWFYLWPLMSTRGFRTHAMFSFKLLFVKVNHIFTEEKIFSVLWWILHTAPKV